MNSNDENILANKNYISTGLISEIIKTNNAKKRFIVSKVLLDLPSAKYKNILNLSLSKMAIPDNDEINNDKIITEDHDTITSLKDINLKNQILKIRQKANLKKTKPDSLVLTSVEPASNNKLLTPLSKREFTSELRKSSIISIKNKFGLVSLENKNSEVIIDKLKEIKNTNEEVIDDDEKIDPVELKKFFKKIIDHDKFSEKRKKRFLMMLLRILASFFVILVFLMGIILIYCLITQIQEIENRNLLKMNKTYS
jgi:hypothetical protein